MRKLTALFLLPMFISIFGCKHKAENELEDAPKKTCLITQEENTRKQVTKYVYDDLGRLYELGSPGENSIRYFYDSLNNISVEEFWQSNRISEIRKHYYNGQSLTDSVFRYQSYPDSSNYLMNVSKFNAQNLPIENKYYMGNSYPVHEVYFEYDASGNLAMSIEAYQNGWTVFKRYVYDDKKSPYPKSYYQYIPLSLNKNNVIQVLSGQSGNNVLETYKYVYNQDGYPVRKDIRKDEFMSPQFDTLTYSLLCE